jgi:hypothetical protein
VHATDPVPPAPAIPVFHIITSSQKGSAP